MTVHVAVKSPSFVVTVITAEPAPKPVTGVALNETEKTITAGDSFTLTPTISPSNATNKSVTWTSSNTSIASVYNGTVTGLGAGSTVITVTTNDGDFTATCTVTVNSASGDHGKTIDDPLSIQEAIALIDQSNSESWYVEGIVTSIPGSWSTSYHNMRVTCSPTDQSSTSFEFYRLGTEDDADPNLAAGDTIVGYGTLTKYQSTYEMAQGCVLKKVTTVQQKAANFASSFNDANVCGTNNNTPAIQSVWNSMYEQYNGLDSYTRTYLSNVDLSSETNTDIKEAIERYDMVVSKHSTFNDYLGRRSANGSNITTTASGTIVIMTAVTLLSLLGVAFIFYRKRKEQ